jgi:ParB-like chromosome segregation protein Spo0J
VQPSYHNPTSQQQALAPEQPFNWRTHLPVHPAAALYPLLSESDPIAFKELVDDIKVNGLIEPLVFWNGDGQDLLDGRNRLDALAALGLL